ncbi:MAG: YHS domain-containing protein [Deltaproteobacteria bacterium]|jgi:Cu+-exporting ATPase|nr:MAG: YHS domain-containing protein [Deltaproteobacteria bacterium]
MKVYPREKVVDPVCGMEVSLDDPRTMVSKYKGRSYYFCAQCCVRVFEKNPQRYLKAKGPFGRFLVRLVNTNVKVFGRAGPPCH